MKVSKALANNLRRLRKSAGLSQDQLGDLANLSQQTITDLETQKKFCGSETIQKLAKALKVEETALFADPSIIDNELVLKRVEQALKK